MRQDIKAYVDRWLLIKDIYCEDEEKKLRDYFVTLISSMPVYHQVFLIETKRLNVTTGSETLKDFFQQMDENHVRPRVLNGYYASELRFKRCDTGKVTPNYKNVVLWHYNAREIYGGFQTFFHEHGHRVDHLIHYREEDGDYWSEKNRKWYEALRKTIAQNNDPQALRQYPAAKEFLQNKGLYKRALNLICHLGSYTPGQYASEAFAEMTCHHLSLHVLYADNPKRIDDILMRQYEFLWPVYKSEIIPRLQEYADLLLKNRDKEIKTYKGLFNQYAKAGYIDRKDLEFCDYDISVKSADGTLSEAIRHMKTKLIT